MKKLYMLLVISLFLSLSFIPSYADSPKPSEYTFSYATQILSNEIFPEIEEYIKDNSDSLISDPNLFAGEILKILKKYVDTKKILFSLPPMVKVFTLQNRLNKVYMLEIKMIIYDGSESRPEIRVATLIGKRFIIDVLDKSNI